MNKISLVLTLGLGIGIGLLVARFTSPPVAVVASTPVPEVKNSTKPARAPSVFDNRPARTTETVATEPTAEEATKAALEERFKNFRADGRKMIEDLAKDGDREKIGRAFRSAFQNEDFRQVFQRSRELEGQWATASTEEKPAIMDELQALRTKGVGLFKAEMDKLDAVQVTTPAAPGTAAPAPAPTVIM